MEVEEDWALYAIPRNDVRRSEFGDLCTLKYTSHFLLPTALQMQTCIFLTSKQTITHLNSQKTTYISNPQKSLPFRSTIQISSPNQKIYLKHPLYPSSNLTPSPPRYIATKQPPRINTIPRRALSISSDFTAPTDQHRV
jgi:hypothetical protein